MNEIRSRKPAHAAPSGRQKPTPIRLTSNSSPVVETYTMYSSQFSESTGGLRKRSAKPLKLVRMDFSQPLTSPIVAFRSNSRLV